MSIDRLIKCLEMMSSEHDGECLSAARAAMREMKRLKLRWQDVIKADSSKPAPPTHPTGAGAMHPNTGYGAAPGYGQHPFSQHQQYNPFAQQQQWDPFAQQRAYYEANIREQSRRQQEEFLRQQKAAMDELTRKPKPETSTTNNTQFFVDDPVTKEELNEKPVVDETIISKGEKKRKSFWASMRP